jgi:transcriptional regulator with XRE-family HTH domain
MPAPAPKIGDANAARLARLGARLRARRKKLKVSAVAAAESAGMSRVTWHRIERGEPSVAMAAWLAAATALGLELAVVDPAAEKRKRKVPKKLRVADYPELARLAWQLEDVAELTPLEALALYERNWRHVDRERMSDRERDLVAALVDEVGGGRLLV